MNNTTRLLILVAANFIMVYAMNYWLMLSGFDVQSSTFSENADDLIFAFDFITFLIISFLVNIGIMAIPSKKTTTLKNIVAILAEKEEESRQVKRRKQRQRA